MRWGCSLFSTWVWVCPISLVRMMATHPAKLFGVLPRCISLRAAPSAPQAYLNVEAVKGVTRSITGDDANQVRCKGTMQL